jgi:two-component system, probable response regulator PhcQ
MDDDAGMLSRLTQLLIGQPVRTLTAQDSENALTLMAAIPVDIVLCDDQAIGVRGTTVLREIKQIWPNTISIVMTNNIRRASAARMSDHDDTRLFVLKPLNETELLLAIRHALDKCDALDNALDESEAMDHPGEKVISSNGSNQS